MLRPPLLWHLNWMKWACALSVDRRSEAALAEAADAVQAQLGGERADLLVLFVSADHVDGLEELVAELVRRFPKACRIGCSGGGVIGGGREVEQGPALALIAARLPGVKLTAFHLDQLELPGPGEAAAWRAKIGEPDDGGGFILLADPFTIDPDALVSGLDEAFPRVPKVGGLASGGLAPGANRLISQEGVWHSGAVGVALSGNVSVEAIVAQGCRPIGAPMLVTRHKGSLIQELDGKTPLQVLQDIHESLDDRDRELFSHSLFVGVEMRDDKVEYRQGDFLIRHLVGVDPERGSMAVACEPRPYQVVQFHLRDGRTAEEDLIRHLRRHHEVGGVPGGALLFSCLGRGEHLFGKPDHDSGLFRSHLGDVPLAGFFCNGEIGPVGGKTFLHGYTSAFALFSAKLN